MSRPTLSPRHPLRAALSLTAAILCVGCAPSGGEPEEMPPFPGVVATEAHPVEGAEQALYVPIYSHIYYRDRTRVIDLTATLSVRNTDPARSLTLVAVRYHDSAGQLVRQYLSQPRTVGPLATESFVVEQEDQAGGTGANFLVLWHADSDVNAPLAEAVMISTAGSQGISFVSRGLPVRLAGDRASAADSAPSHERPGTPPMTP